MRAPSLDELFRGDPIPLQPVSADHEPGLEDDALGISLRFDKLCLPPQFLPMSTRLAGAFLFLAWLGLGSLVAADPPAQPKLIGLTHSADGRPLAMLELGRGGSGRPPERLALHEGERLGSVELLAIDVAKAQVILRLAGKEITLPLATGTTNAEPPALSLHQADLETVLRLYAEAAGRTVLKHPELPVVSLSLAAPATNRLDMLHALEELLKTNEIVVVPDWEHFVKVVPKSLVAGELMERRPDSWAAAERAARNATGKPAEIGAGEINFLNADWRQVAPVYAALRGRTLVPPDRDLPPGKIVLHTQTPLTKEEAVYALDILFRWHRIVFEDVGDQAIKAVLAGKAK